MILEHQAAPTCSFEGAAEVLTPAAALFCFVSTTAYQLMPSLVLKRCAQLSVITHLRSDTLGTSCGPCSTTHPRIRDDTHVGI